MQSNILISVIIPTYNRSEYISAAIQSVLNQSITVHEILICDDGSSDDTKTVVQQFNHPHIIWLDCGKNGRPAIPRNIGITKAKGNWIAFLDSDDEWLPNKLEVQIKQAQLFNCSVICTNAWAIQGEQKKMFFTNLTSKTISFDVLIASNIVICSSLLCEKKILIQAGQFPESIALKAVEDYVLWLSIAAKHQIYYIHEPLVNYLELHESSIRQKGDDTITQRAKIFEHFKQTKQLGKKQLKLLYSEFKGQYKHRILKLFDRAYWSL
jgi:teichuronic acid biosynthesis glycosyltransferase TuaG